MLSAVSAKSDIVTTLPIRGSQWNLTRNLIKAKRYRRERVREEIGSARGKKKKQTQLGFDAIISGGWNSADLYI